jgi:hypothetical protein
MEGAVLREQRALNREIVGAWHTAVFVLGMYSGKLKGKKLSDFLSGQPEQQTARPIDAVAFFHRMKSAGFPIEIKKVVH